MDKLTIYADPNSRYESYFYHPDTTDEFDVIDAEEDEGIQRRGDFIVTEIVTELNSAARHIHNASMAMVRSGARVNVGLQRVRNTTSQMNLHCDAALIAVLMLSEETPATVSFRTEKEQWDCISCLFNRIINTLEIKPHWLIDVFDASSYATWNQAQAKVEFMKACAERERESKRACMDRMNRRLERVIQLDETT